MRALMMLFPATAIAVAGYVVLYFAGRSEGRMRTFGRWLGGWTLFLAALVVIGGLTAPLFGGRPFGLGPTMEERMARREAMRQRMMDGGAMRPPPAMPQAPAMPPPTSN